MKPHVAIPLLASQLALGLLLAACSGSTGRQSGKKAHQRQSLAATTRFVASATPRERIPETHPKPLNKVRTLSGDRKPAGKPTPKKDRHQPALQTWRSSLAEKPQLFRANADENLYIKGKHGTEIRFPAHSFTDAGGHIVHGEIELQLKECYNFLSFFAEGLSTHTVDDELIETGGTIHLQAFQNGNELAVAPGTAGAVFFPNNGQEKPGMQTFYGETNEQGSVIWNTSNAPTSQAALQPWPVAGNRNNTTTIPYRPQSYPRLKHTEVTTKKDNDVFAKKVTWQLKEQEGTLLKWFETTDLTDTVLINYLVRHKNRLVTMVRFDENGKVKKASFGKKTRPEIAAAMEAFLKSAPAVDIQKMGRYKTSSIYMLGVEGWSFAAAPPIESIVRTAGVDSAQYADLTKAYTALAVTKMGWINCDRFYKDQRPKLDYFVAAPPETQIMVLQFTKIRSQMMGYRSNEGWVFPNLPQGEPVKLIAIGVADEQRLITIQHNNIGPQKNTLEKGRVFTDQELANVLD